LAQLFSYTFCMLDSQMQKKRLMSQNDDKKTERDKLFAEQRAIKDSIRGPTNLQVSLQLPLSAILL
jgi:hypothetical protein